MSCRSLPGIAGLVAEHLPHLSAIVHHHLALPVHARQQSLYCLLDSEFADDVARVVLGELRLVQFRFADFSGVPDAKWASLKRKPDEEDKERYQTVYAKHEGAVAAPTAGLHFSRELIKRLEIKGIRLQK